MATVQERSVKDAAIDLKLELQLQEALFRSNTEKLFVNVDIQIIEQRVLLVGNVSSQELRDQAARIAWEISPKIKDVLNEITIGKKASLVSEAKDARISLSLSGLLIADIEVSDINFSHSVSRQVIYLIGIASNDKELNKFFKSLGKEKVSLYLSDPFLGANRRYNPIPPEHQSPATLSQTFEKKSLHQPDV